MVRAFAGLLDPGWSGLLCSALFCPVLCCARSQNWSPRQVLLNAELVG